jgi:predicted ribosome quality control (RQC) complex YloA/Tae2 family protein
MHNNYYFLRQLSQQLNGELTGFKIGEVFSQVKDELIISLYNEKEEKTIKAHLSPAFCCLSFLENFTRARRNSIDLFQQIIGLEIIDIVQIEQDRSFYFQLGDESRLLFKMHGNRSNVILIREENVIEVFKISLKQDFLINTNLLSNHVNTDKVTFENADGNYKTMIPTFGKSFDRYFESKNYEQLNPEEQYQCFIAFLDYLKTPDFFIHREEEGLPVLSLYEISSDDLRFQNPVEVLSAFYKQYISSFRLEKEKSNLRQSLNAQIKKGESYIKKSSSKLNKLMSASNYKHVADLIMANLHTIKPHASEVELIDFYSQKPVIVRLKAGLSPQHNAEKYYNKSKKQQIEFNTLKNNIERRELQIKEFEKQKEELSLMTKLKQIEKTIKSKPKHVEYPYQLVNYMGYDILIGKNAIKNEQLTFKVAKKDDLFLHAKDSSGSHVIIKKKSNQNFPQAVIEKAASFAAYHSKNKSEVLCRVLYTPKKHVRKAKGAPTGAVIVEREKVILVKAEKIENRN